MKPTRLVLRRPLRPAKGLEGRSRAALRDASLRAAPQDEAFGVAEPWLLRGGWELRRPELAPQRLEKSRSAPGDVTGRTVIRHCERSETIAMAASAAGPGFRKLGQTLTSRKLHEMAPIPLKTLRRPQTFHTASKSSFTAFVSGRCSTCRPCRNGGSRIPARARLR